MSSDSESVPKLPRGRGLKFSGPELFRIALTLLTLIGVIVLTRPCATAVSGFVTSFDDDDKQQVPKPGTVDVPAPAAEQQYESLRPGMTEAEIKAAVERSKARAAGSANAAGSVNAAGSASSANGGGSANAAGSASSANGEGSASSGSNAPTP